MFIYFIIIQIKIRRGSSSPRQFIGAEKFPLYPYILYTYELLHMRDRSGQ